MGARADTKIDVRALLLAPVSSLSFFFWSRWQDDLRSATGDANTATDQRWRIELRGPEQAYVAEAEHLAFYLPWIAMGVAAVALLLIAPLYIKLFRPAHWRRLRRAND